MKSFIYKAFGLTIESELKIPELLPGSRGSKPDVSIAAGAVPSDLRDACSAGVLYQAAPGRFLLQVEKVCRYLAEDGCRIALDRAVGSRDDATRLFLLGPVLGALLKQRNLLVLQGSAVETSSGAAVFLGASGSGKSTLAAALHQRGYRVLADHVCALSTQQECTVLPAFPRLLLWADALQCLGISDLPERVRPGLAKHSFRAHRFASQPVCLQSVYTLSTSYTAELAIHPSQGAGKLLPFIQHAYLRPLLNGMGMQERHFEQAVSASQASRVCRIAGHFGRLPALVDHLEHHLG